MLDKLYLPKYRRRQDCPLHACSCITVYQVERVTMRVEVRTIAHCTCSLVIQSVLKHST